MSISSPGGDRQRQDAANRWATIRYALDNNARTVRLCVIMLVAGIPPGLIALLIRH